MGAIDHILKLAGRVAIAAVFLWAAYGKIMNPSGTIQKIQSAGLPVPWLAYGAAVALLVFGGVCLVIGWKTRIAALALIVFLLLAAYFFHHNLADRLQLIMVLKNLAIIGGLMYVIASGPGRISLDKS